jgi:hypothetical protein
MNFEILGVTPLKVLGAKSTQKNESKRQTMLDKNTMVIVSVKS